MPARLAQHLVARGLLSAQTIEDAQRRRATFGGTLDTVLLEMGAIAEAGMLQALADVSGLKPVNLADFEPNEEMARFVPANVAERLGAVPLSVDGDTLHVATSFPPNQRELEEVALLLGKKLEAWVAIETRIRDWIAVIYGTELPPRYQLLLQQLDPTRAPPPPPAPQPAPLKPIPVEEASLEDALTREMVEQIARAVAEEPILLEVRKKPKTPRPEPQMAAQMGGPAQPPKAPATWERDATVPIDLNKLQALARESARATGAPAPSAPASDSSAVPKIAPLVPPVPPPPPPPRPA
ncbi:MAG: FrgA protein, partial [Myxococcaceae bacterium]|nr:FrgA protein [Myxococcaceae bacterium]